VRRTALLLLATIAVLVWLLAGCASYDLVQEALQALQEPLGEATNGRIAFQTSGAIWAINANGSDPRLLTETVSESGWSISPDGEKIAFAAERTEVNCGNSRGDCPEETTAQIYVMNADGSDQTKLLEDVGGSPPDWSPDSKKMAFGLSDADARRCALYAMNANGWGDPIPLTNFDGCYSIESLAWSLDGKKIAVEILEEGNGYDNDIYVLDVPAEDQTSQPQQLTNGPHTWWNADPTWSPDSTEIAYTHMNTAVFENQWSIYKMNADGSGKTRLAVGRVYYEPPNNPPPGPVAMDSLAWSPDGEKIALVMEYPDESPTISSAIYVMKSDGSDNPTLIRRFQSEAVSNLEWLPRHVDLPLATPTTSAPGQQPKRGP
jgi:Tol biopolymer transport system component